MALSPLERIKLQRQVVDVRKQIKESTKPLEKIKLIKERMALYQQLGIGLKKQPAPGAPAVQTEIAKLSVKAPNKNVIFGFDGINGVNHPSWANKGSDSSLYREIIYTDTRSEIAAYVEIDSLRKGEKLKPNDVYFGDESLAQIKRQKVNAGRFEPTKSKREIERLENIAEQVADYVNGIFPLEYKGFTIDPAGSHYLVSNHVGSTITPAPLAEVIAKIDNGEIEKAIIARKQQLEDELAEMHANRKDRQALSMATDDDVQSVMHRIQNPRIRDDASGDAIDLTPAINAMAALNERKVKLTADQAEAIENEIKSYGRHNFTHAMRLELADNDKLTFGGTNTQADTDNSTNAMFEKYREGAFNGEEPEQFKRVMHQVYDLGMPVTEVSDGMVSWFKANPDQLAA